MLEAVGKRFGHEFRFTEALAGGAAYDAFGEHLPQSTLATCEAADAILKGPFGGPRDEINHPKWQGVEQNAILPLRKHFDLYLNLRPIVVPDSLLALSPIKEEFVKGTDMLILRELASGIYFGPRGEREIEGPHEKMQREVWDTELYNEYEIERIARDGFRLAQARRKQLTLIAKSNVMSTGLFWREVVGADRAGVPGRDDELPARRRGVYGDDRQPAPVRRHRHLEHLRRHPRRTRRRGCCARWAWGLRPR